MKTFCVLLILSLISSVICTNEFDLSEESLHSLKNKIKEKVYRRIGHLSNSKSKSRNVETTEALDLTPDKEEEELAEDTARLHNLGDQIKHDVYKKLEPVFALRSALRMKHGVGGKTKITYGDDKTLILINTQMYECDGDISDSNGECSGKLKLYVPEEDVDFCYMVSYMEIDNQVCLSSVPVKGEKCVSKNGKVLSLEKKKYEELCADIVNRKRYKYFSDIKNKKHVTIPYTNKLISCLNDEPGICEFTNSHVPETSQNVKIVSH